MKNLPLLLMISLMVPFTTLAAADSAPIRMCSVVAECEELEQYEVVLVEACDYELWGIARLLYAALYRESCRVTCENLNKPLKGCFYRYDGLLDISAEMSDVLFY